MHLPLDTHNGDVEWRLLDSLRSINSQDWREILGGVNIEMIFKPKTRYRKRRAISKTESWTLLPFTVWKMKKNPTSEMEKKPKPRDYRSRKQRVEVLPRRARSMVSIPWQTGGQTR